MASSADTRASLLFCLYIVAVLLDLSCWRVRAWQLYACSKGEDVAFCDRGRAVEERVQDLVGRLTLEEKVAQLGHMAPGVERLGVPPYDWWSEALHGVSNVGPAVSFSNGGPVRGAVSYPQVITMAASFNRPLWRAIGQAVSTEARAMFNLGQSGLTFWSPNINIFRDPRWGRGQETPGEDPLLTSQYAVHYVHGLQDVDHPSNNFSDSLKVAACCKHYTAYDLDNWNSVDRFHFDAKVTQQDLDDTYQPPFKSCVEEGNSACVMCSYNRVNGVPTCVDENLLKDTVRKQWNLNGYIVTDCDSLDVLYNMVHYTNSPEDAVAAAFRAGLNLNCGTFLPKHTAAAVAQGKLKEADVDQSLAYLYTVWMRLGLFDGPDSPFGQVYSSLGAHDVCTEDHRKLAIDAAREGIVLLKNDKESLPLSASRVRTLAVIGPNANATKTMIGNYAGVPCRYTSPLQGLAAYASEVIYEPGCDSVACGGSDDAAAAAVKAAAEADAVVMVMGLDQSQESEALDRSSLRLPGNQESLVKRVAEAAKGPVVLAIMSGGPVDVSFVLQGSPSIPAMLWVGYPGEAGGQAIAEIIYGDCNPSGKLPMSWYPDSYTKIPMTDMRMRPDATQGYPGRTYRFYTGETLYKFGDGLSYTNFSHSLMVEESTSEIKLAAHAAAGSTYDASLREDQFGVHELQCEDLDFHLVGRVHNVGRQRGSYVLMLFWHPPARARVDFAAPTRQLVAFHRVHDLGPNEVRHINTSLNVCQHLTLSSNQGGGGVVLLGTHKIEIEDTTHFFTISKH